MCHRAGRPHLADLVLAAHGAPDAQLVDLAEEVLHAVLARAVQLPAGSYGTRNTVKVEVLSNQQSLSSRCFTPIRCGPTG